MPTPTRPLSQERVANDLVELTRALVTVDPTIERSGGLLGGRYGYGVHVENPVFTMHPYCWCDRDDCPWCWGCTCPDGARRYLDPEGNDVTVDVFYDSGGYTWGTVVPVPDKQCDYCRGERVSAPHFAHLATGITVHWYKYIGRGMQVHVPAEATESAGDPTAAWDRAIAECHEWLRAHADTLR